MRPIYLRRTSVKDHAALHVAGYSKFYGVHIAFTRIRLRVQGEEKGESSGERQADPNPRSR